MTIEYLGNKRQLLHFVLRPILELSDVETVVDVFCGTAAVSRGLAESGRRVIANDHLHLCAMLAEAQLLGPASPRFDGLVDAIAPRPGESRYSAVVRVLNETAPLAGLGATGAFRLDDQRDAILSGHDVVSVLRAECSPLNHVASRDFATQVEIVERYAIVGTAQSGRRNASSPSASSSRGSRPE